MLPSDAAVLSMTTFERISLCTVNTSSNYSNKASPYLVKVASKCILVIRVMLNLYFDAWTIQNHILAIFK